MPVPGASNWQKLLAANAINDPLQKPNNKKRKREEEKAKEKKGAKGGKGAKARDTKKVHIGEVPTSGVTRFF